MVWSIQPISIFNVLLIVSSQDSRLSQIPEEHGLLSCLRPLFRKSQEQSLLPVRRFQGLK